MTRFVRRQLERFRGEEIDTAGDGFLAVFDGPGRAIHCALEICALMPELGLELRAGVHTGEVERPRGEQTSRHRRPPRRTRRRGAPGAGEVLVTSTTHDLVAGSGITVHDRGEHRLKGIPEQWHLFAVVHADGRTGTSTGAAWFAREDRRRLVAWGASATIAGLVSLAPTKCLPIAAQSRQSCPMWCAQPTHAA